MIRFNHQTKKYDGIPVANDLTRKFSGSPDPVVPEKVQRSDAR